MKLKFIGHSCFLLEYKEYKILIDPFITGNPNINLDPLSIEANYILVSHGHSDHVGDSVEISKKNSAKIIANYEVAEYCEKLGANTLGMNIGGMVDLDFCKIKLVTAIHSSRLPDGSYGGNPKGFLVYNDEFSLYFAGDSALTLDMQLIPKLAPKLDFAILPMGDYYTMGIEDCVLAAQFIDCQRIIACHFDTFPPIKLDRNKALNAFDKNGIELIIPMVGEYIKL